MAIYSLQSQIISADSSVVTAAAYDARDELYSEKTGKNTKNFAGRGGLVTEFMAFPSNAPLWTVDLQSYAGLRGKELEDARRAERKRIRQKFWNLVERVEHHKRAQYARAYVIALPHELNDERQEKLVREFVQQAFVERGETADVAIHRANPNGDEKNDHFHVIVSMRKFDGTALSKRKSRELNSREFLENTRALWARLCGDALLDIGNRHEAAKMYRGHLSLKEQHRLAILDGDLEKAARLDRPPTRHDGKIKTAIMRRQKAAQAVPTIIPPEVSEVVLLRPAVEEFVHLQPAPTIMEPAHVKPLPKEIIVAPVVEAAAVRHDKPVAPSLKDVVAGAWFNSVSAEDFRSQIEGLGYALKMGNRGHLIIADNKAFKLVRLLNDRKQDASKVSAVTLKDVVNRLGGLVLPQFTEDGEKPGVEPAFRAADKDLTANPRMIADTPAAPKLDVRARDDKRSGKPNLFWVGAQRGRGSSVDADRIAKLARERAERGALFPRSEPTKPRFFKAAFTKWRKHRDEGQPHIH